ncbi:MAG: lipocalin family protein [Luteimonas sp.]|nr:lipocalin family protein [Luteimonas sp.]
MIATGCAGKDARPIPPVAKVDLPRFMGDWYVIANIPTFPERNAYAATESYALKPDGRVQTTYRYRKGSFDAPVKTIHPVGTVRPGTGNAVWGMQFIWPIKAEYVIAYLAPDYSQTIIARNDRDYAWVMARTPAIPEDEYQQHMQRLHKWGYDIGKVRRVPQQPPGDGTSPARP